MMRRRRRRGFLEKDEKGTSIARHVSRYIRFGQKASRYSFVGKERCLWIANFTWYVGLLISTLPASGKGRETIERESFHEMSRDEILFYLLSLLIIPLIPS